MTNYPEATSRSPGPYVFPSRSLSLSPNPFHTAHSLLRDNFAASVDLRSISLIRFESRILQKSIQRSPTSIPYFLITSSIPLATSLDPIHADATPMDRVVCPT